MNREQLIKDFSELYVGQNPSSLTEEYRMKKRKEILLLVTGGLILIILCFVKDMQSTGLENNKLHRDGTESGKEEIVLQMKQENGVWEDVFLELHPKEYSEEDLEQLFLEVCEQLPRIILNKNESLDSIHSDLNFVQEIEGYPFLIQWRSSKPQILDENGHLLYPYEKIDEVIEVRTTLQYEDWEKEHSILVRVTARQTKDFVTSLEEELKEREQMTREKEEFELPSSFQKKALQWRYMPGNSALILGILFMVVLPIIFYEKDREIHKQTMQRREELQQDFPEFISKLILLLEAGMNIRRALFQIVEDGQKRSKMDNKKSYLYMELLYICRQMQNGLSEKEAYELLGKRCNLSCYKKLSGLLVQHLQKGGSNILEMLRNESRKACDEQRRQIQKKGEEMETKLLFPMMIMLGIVMVFIMVPALFSFQM